MARGDRRYLLDFAWLWAGCLEYPEYTAKLRVIPEKDYPLVAAVHILKYVYRHWDSNFWRFLAYLEPERLKRITMKRIRG